MAPRDATVEELGPSDQNCFRRKSATPNCNPYLQPLFAAPTVARLRYTSCLTGTPLSRLSLFLCSRGKQACQSRGHGLDVPCLRLHEGPDLAPTHTSVASNGCIYIHAM